MNNTVKIISPVDGSLYAERPYATNDTIQKTVVASHKAQRAWRTVSLEERAKFCQAAVTAMRSMESEIINELAWQMGRPIRYGQGELNGFQERAEHMIAIAAEALADVQVAPKEGFERYISHEPLGTVFVIAPWNYPYLTAVNSIIPALMAGNAVILKHAAQTLLVGERFQQAFDQAGLPKGLFQNLVLTHAQTATIIQQGQVHQVNFTGSVPGGRAMEEAAAGRFIGLGLELGGKDPAYVRADADLPHAIENLVDGAFFNSGQSCCGIERIYVHADVFDPFVDGFVDLTQQYSLGSPLDHETTLGPMVKASAADFVRQQIAEAVDQGANPLIDPTRFALEQAGSTYLAPQLLVNVNHGMRVMTEESFGPVVGIMSVADDQEAVTLMNDSPYGLTASVWTTDVEAVKQLGPQLDTGTVFMNRCDYLDPALAWTGVKETGRGVTLSRLGYDSLTRPKSYHLRY